MRSDGEETKNRIVLRATQLFVQKGYGAVTMNEVCDKAQVSKGSLYHHFPSKEELFLHVLEADTDHWLRQWEEIHTGCASTEERIYALAEHYANDIQNPLIREVETFAKGREITEGVTRRLEQIYREGSEACRELVREALDSGYFKEGEVEDYVLIISGMLEGLGKICEWSGLGDNISKVKAYYRKAVACFLDGVRAPAH
ncbi:TetR/AcrR family transcriptional regulator [Gorillibacterium massiliense]|uniref:TetR/AcrR family transcriptional regulator n=1 Tax=Gorillibacterium massiliense TaxID=1280390 RepID=UPI0004B1EA00|nr:TetR/AcrR family transcriptional regulator [Gorillibacterium massiliense]